MIKQERYAQKMIREGFVTVRSWIPKEKEDELKRITKTWRDEKNEAQRATDNSELKHKDIIMLADETAGIDCINCGFEKVVTTKAESESLIKYLQWTKNGDAKCPKCDHAVTYEDYINE